MSDEHANLSIRTRPDAPHIVLVVEARADSVTRAVALALAELARLSPAPHLEPEEAPEPCAASEAVPVSQAPSAPAGETGGAAGTARHYWTGKTREERQAEEEHRREVEEESARIMANVDRRRAEQQRAERERARSGHAGTTTVHRVARGGVQEYEYPARIMVNRDQRRVPPAEMRMREALGRLVQTARIKARFTQEEVSQLVNISQRQMAKMEQGGKVRSEHPAYKLLLDLFQITPDRVRDEVAHTTLRTRAGDPLPIDNR